MDDGRIAIRENRICGPLVCRGRKTLMTTGHLCLNGVYVRACPNELLI